MTSSINWPITVRSAVPFRSGNYIFRSKFGERCFSYAGPAAWNSLPHSIKLSTDTNRSKTASQVSSISYCFLTLIFVSGPGQFVSRALQVPICNCICADVIVWRQRGKPVCWSQWRSRKGIILNVNVWTSNTLCNVICYFHVKTLDVLSGWKQNWTSRIPTWSIMLSKCHVEMATKIYAHLYFHLMCISLAGVCEAH